MMTALFGGGGASKYEVAGYLSATTRGTALTANATPGSDGAWTEVIAAIANDWYGFHVILHYGGTTTGMGLVDVGIGAAAAEVVIVADMPYTHLNSNVRSASSRLWLPLYVAKGTRVAARIHRSDVASHAHRIELIGETSPLRGMPPFRRATTYGTVLASARGTPVDPGGTANTLGANTQIVASTTNPIRSLYLMAMKQDGAAVAVDATHAMEVYVGGAGSEVVLVPETVLWELHSGTDISCPFGWGLGPFNVGLPSGIRLSAKARSSTTTAGARESQLTLIGLD